MSEHFDRVGAENLWGAGNSNWRLLTRTF